MFHHNPSKRGEDYSKFVDECGEDVSRLAQIRAILPAEKGPSKVLLVVEPFTN